MHSESGEREELSAARVNIRPCFVFLCVETCWYVCVIVRVIVDLGSIDFSSDSGSVCFGLFCLKLQTTVDYSIFRLTEKLLPTSINIS